MGYRKKLFKGKGINLFRGFKAQGLDKAEKENISPKDCRINFAVPSNPILAAESKKYTVGAESPGILTLSLDAFAENDKEKDVKLSTDGKKIALGMGKNSDENLCGFENSPTLKECQERFAKEKTTAKKTKDNFDDQLSDGNLKIDETGQMENARQCLLLTISNISKCVHELREFTVKRKSYRKFDEVC